MNAKKLFIANPLKPLSEAVFAMKSNLFNVLIKM